MKKKLLHLFLLLNLVIINAQDNSAAQEAERKKAMEAALKTEDNASGWTTKGGIGLDLGQLANINPYIGGGSNRLGFGGAIAYKANYKKNLLSWNNDVNVNLSTQRIGNGALAVGSKDKVPFEKALDLFTISSNCAYKIKDGSPWAYSADLFFLSQLLGSYQDSANKKIYLKEVNTAPFNTNIVSKLFSPANITFALGLKYQKKDNWYAFISPVALKAIVVADQDIANLGYHGTEKNDDGTYKQSRIGVGALGRAGYSAKLWNRVNFGSEMLLFSDYIDNPQNIDVTWLNNIGLEIVKGLNLNFRVDAFYDDNKINNVSDRDAIGGISGQGKRTNWIQQLLLVYNRNF
ncbi:MAG: DUF3078 domain-containing protein [Saprospiraceae bacterium]|nr:DUF3078 domain-containing protein [Saprospiraceae bacterium]